MGQGANMTVNNFSPYDIQVAVVRKHCIYPQSPNGYGAPGIDAFNVRLPHGESHGGYIEDKNTSTGGDLCATDTGYFELSFTVMRGDVPDPRYTLSTTTIAIPHDHFQQGDGHKDGAVKVDLIFLPGKQDSITIGLKDNV
ncbi:MULTISPECIES: hypothetical protein [Sorangium]|jgi:hypothetical protein|uniref:Uncharacterized protein n=1 Tax=Sorangium atrum TaxID=2995308 RepID=A0ABT5CBT1_9BACT|nr:hypothetical protein [Sorangium aterium]MDC0683889.1 hypothetical protein [Sorangium aterium]